MDVVRKSQTTPLDHGSRRKRKGRVVNLVEEQLVEALAEEVGNEPTVEELGKKDQDQREISLVSKVSDEELVLHIINLCIMKSLYCQLCRTLLTI